MEWSRSLITEAALAALCTAVLLFCVPLLRAKLGEERFRKLCGKGRLADPFRPVNDSFYCPGNLSRNDIKHGIISYVSFSARRADVLS